MNKTWLHQFANFTQKESADMGVCFGTASTSDVTSQLNSWERGGALDTKNPDLYYLGPAIVRLLKMWAFKPYSPKSLTVQIEIACCAKNACGL